MATGKYIYDLDSLMRRTGACSLSELQDMGYDVIEYLNRRKIELQNESKILTRLEDELRTPKSSQSSYYNDDEMPFYGSFNPSSEDYIGT